MKNPWLRLVALLPLVVGACDGHRSPASDDAGIAGQGAGGGAGAPRDGAVPSGGAAGSIAGPDGGADAGLDGAPCVPQCAGRCGGSDSCNGTCPNVCVAPSTCGGAGAPDACGAGLHAIGGTVTGLSSTIVLANGNDRLTVSSNGTFVFPQKASSYAVSVSTQPGAPAQQCTVGDGASGIATADVTDIEIDCPPFVVAGGLVNPYGVKAGGSSLYFTTSPPRACGTMGNPPIGVMMVSSQGGQPSTISPIGDNAAYCGAYGPVLDSSYVYWYDSSEATFHRAALSGANVERLFSLSVVIDDFVLDAADGWIFYHSLGLASGAGTPGIGRASIDGSGQTMFSQPVGAISGFAIDGSNLYWTNPALATVNKIPLNASPLPATPALIESNVGGLPWAPFVTSTTLYWVWLNTAVRDAPVSSLTAATLYPTQSGVGALAVIADASFVWLLSPGGSLGTDRIYKVPVGGGAPVVVAKNLYQAKSFTMDATHIYWTTLSRPLQTDGAIGMIVK